MNREEQGKTEPRLVDATERAGRLGRRVGTGVYLALLTYVIGIGFVTFVDAIFLRPVRAETPEERAEPCELACAKLAHALHERVGSHVGGDTAGTDAFFRHWDDRFDAMRDRCDGDSTEQLERARHRLEITLHRFDRESAPSLARLEAPLQSSTEELSR